MGAVIDDVVMLSIIKRSSVDVKLEPALKTRMASACAFKISYISAK